MEDAWKVGAEKLSDFEENIKKLWTRFKKRLEIQV